jgi:ADP-heptose:LPS heptosyltransferase
MITEVLLALLCLLYAPVLGLAKKPVTEPKRILIVQMMKLGDMVCTTPMFRAVKNRYPDAHLTVVGNNVNRELLAGNTDVDEYIVFSGIFKMISALRRGGYDYACVTAPSTPYLAVLFLAGIRTITVPVLVNGTSPNETTVYRFLSKIALTRPHAMHQYAPREYLRLLEPIGITATDTTKHLSYTKEARAHIDAYLAKSNVLGSGRLLVGLAPSAGHKTKEWFPERFAEVIIELKKRYELTVLLIAGKSDATAGRPVLEHLPPNTVIDTCGAFTLEETKALFDSLDMFIGVDTGPIYLAEASGVPTVDITGPIDEREQPPIGEMHVVVTPPAPRTPQLFVMNAREYDMQEVLRQLDATTTVMVVDACASLIDKIIARRSPSTTDTSS